jgi:hypothetical protein
LEAGYDEPLLLSFANGNRRSGNWLITMRLAQELAWLRGHDTQNDVWHQIEQEYTNFIDSHHGVMKAVKHFFR